MTAQNAADSGEKGTPTERVMAVIEKALREAFGSDNADPYEDDPSTFGVSLDDGATYVEVYAHQCFVWKTDRPAPSSGRGASDE